MFLYFGAMAAKRRRDKKVTTAVRPFRAEELTGRAQPTNDLRKIANDLSKLIVPGDLRKLIVTNDHVTNDLRKLIVPDDRAPCKIRREHARRRTTSMASRRSRQSARVATNPY